MVRQAHHDKKRGFTLLELLLVLAIISSLAGIILMALNPAQRLEEANETKYLANARDLKKAIEAYAIENGGNLPSTFNSLSYGYYDVCKEGESTGCINIDELIPEYLPSIPEDSNNSTAEITGFRIKYDPNSTSIDIYAGDDYTQRIESGTTFTEGLVGYWKMDETASPALDYSGGNHNALWNGDASSVTGKFGNGINQENGGLGNLSVSDIGNPHDMGSGNFSVSMWFKLDSVTSPAAPELFDKMLGATTGYHLRVSYNHEVEMIVKGTLGTVEVNSVNNAISPGLWYHVVAVYDKGNGHKIYINGVKSGSTVYGDAGNVDHDEALRIGRGFNGWSMDGIYDETRVYNRSLNADEVEALYEYGAPPVAHWRFDEGSGTIASDSSGNGNSGILTNGPIWVAGRYGNALRLDGVDDYVSSALQSTINFSSSYTIEQWVYHSRHGDTRSNCGVKAGYTFTKQTSYYGMVLNIEEGNHKITYSHTKLDHSGSTKLYSINTVDLDHWYFVSITYDSLLNQLKLYLDGILQQSADTSGIVYENPSGNVFIGAHNNNCSYQYPLGMVDDTMIYNYARTQEQILHDMNNN